MVETEKRKRRTQDEMHNLLDATVAIIAEETSVSLRHLFYRLVALGLLEKTEKEYGGLSKKTMAWRRAGYIDWGQIIDGTRTYHGPTVYSNMHQMMRESFTLYRRDLWRTQTYHVEIWCEKDAVSSILEQAVEPFAVPVFACKGFGSGGAIHALAQTIKDYREVLDQDTVILYFGDHDPSGHAIYRSIMKNLESDFGETAEFRHIAVNEQQIKQYNLLTRPTKESSHSKNWTGGESVEVDALAPSVLRRLARDTVSSYINTKAWLREMNAEEMERETLETFMASFKNL